MGRSTGAWIAAAAVTAIAGCGPSHPPGYPGFPVPPPPPNTRSQPIPPAVVGRSAETPPPTKVEEPEREMLQEPPLAPPGPKIEAAPRVREPMSPPVRTVPADTLTDEVVVRLLDTGKSAFVRCFAMAVEREPSIKSYKVRVHVELDGAGAITYSGADTTDSALADCLVLVAGSLQFPASGRDVVVDLPLFYRAD